MNTFLKGMGFAFACVMVVGFTAPMLAATAISYFDQVDGKNYHVSTTKPLPTGHAKVVAPQQLTCASGSSTQFPSIAAEQCCFHTVDGTNDFEWDLGAVTPTEGVATSEVTGTTCIRVDTNCSELFCAGLGAGVEINIWGEGG